MSSFQLNQDHVSALRLSFAGFKSAANQRYLEARELSSRASKNAQGPHTITSGLLYRDGRKQHSTRA